MQALKINSDFLDLVLINLGITNGFKCFLIIEHNSLTIIDVVLVAMP